MLQIFSRTCV